MRVLAEGRSYSVHSNIIHPLPDPCTVSIIHYRIKWTEQPITDLIEWVRMARV